MNGSSPPPLLPITQMGATACACLAPGSRGRVLAAVSSAIYLVTDAHVLFWIAASGSPMHRRGAAVSGDLPRLAAGMPFQVEECTVTIDAKRVFDLERAVGWQEPPVRPQEGIRLREFAARAAALWSSLDLSAATGFGVLIPEILRLARGEPVSPQGPCSDALLERARPLVLDVARANRSGQFQQVSGSALTLIGLGAGLTPSGDDFLGGMWFAWKSLRAAYPDCNFVHPAIPLEEYRPRTQAISFILMHDLAQGHAPAPLHDILDGLLEGAPLESIHPFVRQLTRLGHSTGWDLLTGLLTGLLVLYREMEPTARQA